MFRRNINQSRRGSQRDVALVHLQLEAQLRNKRWHDFLCARRDELQSRLGSDPVLPGTSAAREHAGIIDRLDRPDRPDSPSRVDNSEKLFKRVGPDSLHDLGAGKPRLAEGSHDFEERPLSGYGAGDAAGSMSDMDDFERAEELYNGDFHNEFPDAFAYRSGPY